MASNGEKYFRSDDEDIYLKAPYCEFYIPEELFKSTAEFAVDKGDRIRGIGLFDVGFFENGKLIEMRTLKARKNKKYGRLHFIEVDHIFSSNSLTFEIY